MKTFHGSREVRRNQTRIEVRDHGDIDGDPVIYPLAFVDQHEHGRRVYRDDLPRDKEQTFEWGYGGAGPADTAASLLAEVLGEPAPRRVVQAFKDDVVGGLSRDAWVLSADQITGWLLDHAGLMAEEVAIAAEYQRLHRFWGQEA